VAYTFKHGDRPLDGYVMQRGVGRGGFGEVYYAISDGGKEVALKYLRDNPSIELRGVSHCLNLKSPHLVSIFDVKQNADGEYFIVMEYVAGPSLRDLLIAEPKGLGAQKAAYFVREIAKGLAYLHDRGIVHRDLKPGNIFYEDGYVKIGDYGLSKFISVSRHSAQTASVGTVHYMAPEVGSGSYQRSIDIYALGVILYEMLLGRVPYEGSTMGEVLMKHLTAQPEVDELPPPFPDVIRKALAKDPNQRYQTVDEMVEAILDVDDIKQSVVGFNPVSLASAVRRGVGDVQPSPMPSPNPTPMHPVFGPPPPPLRRDRVWSEFAKRHDRISHKVEKKLAKLEAKAGRRVYPGGRPRAGSDADGPAPLTRAQRMQRLLLSAMMSAGIAIGVGVLIGSQSHSGEFGASAGLLVVALSAGVGLWQRLRRWMRGHDEVRWAKKALLAGCCAPPMLLASIPMFTTRSSEAGLAAFGALAIAALLINWQSRIEAGAAGELKLGQAFKAGLISFIIAAPLTGILEIRRIEGVVMLLAAAVGAGSSLVVQVFACVRPSAAQRRPPGAPTATPVVQPPVAGRTFASAPAADSPMHAREEPSSGAPYPPLAIPIHEPSAAARPALSAPVPAARWGITRGCWSVVAFLLVSATLALGLWASTSGFYVGDRVGTGIAAVACACAVVFAIGKTTPRPREGLWRENLRPLLLSVSLFGIAAPWVPMQLYRLPPAVGHSVTTVPARSFAPMTFHLLNLDPRWGFGFYAPSGNWYQDGGSYTLLSPEERWGLKVAVGVSLLLFCVLALDTARDRFRARRAKKLVAARPFILPDSTAAAVPIDAPDSKGEVSPVEANA
jgi:hypothetical protein